MRYLCLIAIVLSSIIASPSPPHKQLPSLNLPSFDLITMGKEEVVLPRMQWGLQWIPDGTVSAIHENDTTHWWVAADRSTYYFRSHAASAWKPRITTQGIAQAVFAPDGTGFDADYAAPGTILQLPTHSELLMIYHGEDHHCDPSQRQAISVAIGIARSSDGGQTWVRQTTPILTGQESITDCPQRFTGAGTPSAVLSRDQQYLYVYYGDWYNTPHPNERDEIHMARAAILSNGILGPWQKWYQGAFRADQPGIGGLSDPVMRRSDPEEQTGFVGNPHVQYNARIDRYIAITKSHIGFHYAFSIDGIHWDDARLLLQFPMPMNHLTMGMPWFSYPSLFVDTTSVSDGAILTGYLYYARSHDADGIKPHFLVRQPVQLMHRAFLPLSQHGNARPITLSTVTLIPDSPWHPTTHALWICTGDFLITHADGSQTITYDSHDDTGHVLTIPSGATFQLTAPWGGFCKTTIAGEQTHQAIVQAHQMREAGCASACRAVTIQSADPMGKIVNRDWIPSPPPTLTLDPQEAVRLGQEWLWMCSGDITIRSPSNNEQSLFDDQPATGLITLLHPDTTLIVKAPWGATCQPLYDSGYQASVDQQTQIMQTHGCTTGCSAINVKVLDAQGTLLNEYWIP